MIVSITVIKADNGFVVYSQSDDGKSGPLMVCPNLDKLPEVARKIFGTGNAPKPIRRVVEEVVDEDEE